MTCMKKREDTKEEEDEEEINRDEVGVRSAEIEEVAWMLVDNKMIALVLVLLAALCLEGSLSQLLPNLLLGPWYLHANGVQIHV